MNPFRWHAVLSLTAFLAVAPLARAQQQFTPHVGYVYPAGGRQGTEIQVTVGGQYLDGVSRAFISGPGVQAMVVQYNKPITQGQFNQLRDKLKELTEKKAAARKQPDVKWTNEDDKAVDEIRKKLSTFIRRPTAPAIVETVIVKVTLAPDAAPGERELRLGTPNGLTNPMVFCVGQLPEFSRPPAKAGNEQTPGKGTRYRMVQKSPASEAEMKITLPAIVNGQISPGGVDRYRFQGVKGQQVVVAASARELIPYISDAVPGWFQATLAIYDAKGKQVAYADHYLFHPDPLLHYVIADDGEYVLEVKDSIYRGREDFVYRISAGELPYVTGIFPLGGKAGARTAVGVTGWNLPAAKLTPDAKDKGTGIHQISVRKGELVSNRVPYEVDTLPEVLEKEQNNLPKNAQKVKLPAIVNGRIDRPGDSDVFRFEGRAGDEIVAEVVARRLDSPLDSILKLTDARGKQLAINDDFEDKGKGLLTHHADSRIITKLPANGTYYVQLSDAQRKGGPDYGYRLRISRPQPDFELRMVPSSVSARGGASVPITVYALRRDGFSGEIALKLRDVPQGFTLNGGGVPANQDKVRLTLTVPTARMENPIQLRLEGRASIQGREIVHQGVPAEDMMQAFAYRHLVPSHEWMVRVTPGRLRAPWKLASDKPVKLPSGGTALVRLAAPLGQYSSQLKFALSEPPEGISIQSVSAGREGLSFLLRADAGKIKPGLKGNLIVDAFVEGSGGSKAATKKAGQRRQAMGTLPAIAFEVVSVLDARR